MDKTEYHLKLEEINRLVDAQDYEGALTIADSIDWRRVKSVRTLCMVADIYEVNGELEQSMKMLQLAYKRSSIGKMILYRQVELALKMGLNDDAVKYYNQYLETASNDTSKYILKYKIYKAKKAPLEDQIEILESIKNGNIRNAGYTNWQSCIRKQDRKRNVSKPVTIWFCGLARVNM